MKKRILIIPLIFILMFTLACSLTSAISNKITGLSNSGSSGGSGSKNAQPVTTLWSDVPRMDGLTQESFDLPLPARLAVDGYLKSNSKYLGSLDFIAFSTSSTFQQIEDFYTTDRMQAAGWNNPDNPGCAGSISIGGDVGGGVCFFARQNTDNSGAVLALFMSKDTKSPKTQLYFIRLSLTDLPTATPKP